MSIESYLSAIGGEVTNQADQIEIARTMLLEKAAGGGSGDTIDPNLKFYLKGAKTGDSNGTGIDTGIHITGVQNWTMFVEFEAPYSSVSSQLCFVHGMYENGSYPGFSFDMVTFDTGRIAVGTTRYAAFNSIISDGRKKAVLKCESGTLRFFSDRYVGGLSVGALNLVEGAHDSVTLNVGQIKLTNGNYDRHTIMSDIGIQYFDVAKPDYDCISFIN